MLCILHVLLITVCGCWFFFPLSQAVYEYVDNNLSIASSSDTELFGKNVMWYRWKIQTALQQWRILEYESVYFIIIIQPAV